MKLVALPAFADNYIWMLHDGREAVVVDPGDAAPVRAALQAQGLALAGILVTHHHPDHVGGIAALRPLLPGGGPGPVWGPAREAIPQPCTPLTGGDTLTVLGRTLQVIDVPGHTAGHVAYWTQPDNEEPLLFCGDTLFAAGCGRLFEGSPEQMHQSLSRLAALPALTGVYCTHEYTLSNLRFAQAVEPTNADIAARVAQVTQWRAEGRISLPSSIGLELRTNPFLRVKETSVKEKADEWNSLDNDSPGAVFASLRSWKDTF